jgi:phosphoglycerate dehydrogenase-like enzyme
VRAFEPAVEVIDGNAAFSAYHAAARSGDAAQIAKTDADLRAILADADAVCMAIPVLKDVVDMAPKMRWLHHTNAGVSNLWVCDVWQAEHVTVTSGRGYVRPTAMAEYVIAGAFLFSRGMHEAYADKALGKLQRGAGRYLRIEGATMGVVGLGGIGQEVARLAKALGMRVIATRRSAESREENVDGADLLLPASELKTLAAESDFIAVCTQLTRETEHLIDEEIIAAMKPGAVVINVSRGEVIDEIPLIDALNNNRLHGAVLDVYEGETDGKAPRPELMAARNLMLTPHISTSGEGGPNRNLFMELFCENLGRFIANEPLLNVVDRARGY